MFISKRDRKNPTVHLYS